MGNGSLSKITGLFSNYMKFNHTHHSLWWANTRRKFNSS